MSPLFLALGLIICSTFFRKMDTQKIKEIVSEALEENQAFLIDFSISTEKHIVVLADGDQGVTIQALKMINRAIENELGEEHDYSIEVSSPGLDKPFSVFRQYLKNVGRPVTVRKIDGSEEKGKMIVATEEHIELWRKARVPKEVGKGKMTVEETISIPMNEINETFVQIVF